jgi:putative membrane protein
MKLSALIFVVFVLFCSSELIAQTDSNEYLNHSDKTKNHEINTFHQQAPASSYLMDAGFVRQVNDGSLMESELGKLAQGKATSESVKKLAGMIVNDHIKNDNQLKTLAMKNSIPVADGITEENKKDLDDLNSLTGASFDKEFIQIIVKDYQNDIQQFQSASSTVRNPELKNWITKTLPSLKSRLTEAQRIQKELNVM